jgi:hypothetical protein
MRSKFHRPSDTFRQQEGLSFTTDWFKTQNLGGFQAKFGDKLSSVLDITYRKPVQFGATFGEFFLAEACQ